MTKVKTQNVTKLKKNQIVTKLKLWHNTKNQTVRTQKSDCDKTQILSKLKISNCDKTEKFKFWEKNSNTQSLTKLKKTKVL